MFIFRRRPSPTSLASFARMHAPSTLAWSAGLLFESGRDNFCYTYTRHLSVDGEPVREKTWKQTIPRDVR